MDDAHVLPRPAAPERHGVADQPPLSATRTWICWSALAAFLVTVLILRQFDLLAQGPLLVVAISAVAVPIVVLEAAVYGPALPLHPVRRDHRLRRCAIKLVGIVGSFGALAFCYWLIPYFRYGDAIVVYDLFLTIAPWLTTLGPVYVYYVDGRMEEPEDEYYAAGLAFLGRFSQVNKEKLKEHIRSWLVKLFFFQYILPVLLSNLDWATTNDIWAEITAPDFAFMGVFIDAVWMIDVAFASAGYLLTFRLFGSHVRSTDPSLLGWVVCMACYGPFYVTLTQSLLAYEDGLYWGHWLAPYPVAKAVWAAGVVASLSVYVSTSVQFGLRFSNLTHRGIITNGPFRYTKHPQYISKNIAWWLMSVPFIHAAGPMEAFRHCLLLLALNYIYYLRAWTEEQHLSRDPVYREYSAWVAHRGVIARISTASVSVFRRVRGAARYNSRR